MTIQEGSPANTPKTIIKEKDSSTSDFVEDAKAGLYTSKPRFSQKFWSLIEDWTIATLIILKNTLIFGSFLLADKLI